MKLTDFLEEQKIPYKDFALYQEAFTHPSYVNESNKKIKDYERLEFMGDAVLQLYVSEFIFKRLPNVPEGTLTTLRAKLVREESLARFARELGLGQYIFFGSGELKNGGRDRDSVLANVFEAFMGATYLDCGKDMVIKLLEKTIFKHIDDIDTEEIRDFKTTLQEMMQADVRKTVTYELLSTTGPSNAPVFEVAAMMEDIRLGVGTGPSKKKAEQKAAHDALNKLATGKPKGKTH